MNISVKEIYKFIDNIAPFNTSFDWDNTGLLIGNMNENINSVLLALDVTKEVVFEAVRQGCNLILSHHPIIFRPIKSIRSSSMPYLAIENKLNIMCVHTNLDLALEGVNKSLADKLGLKNIKSLVENRKQKYSKIVVFVPKGHENKVKKAMSDSGAGKLGNYSECSFASEGIGSFLPDTDANPYVGESNVLEKVDEVRIEMICPNILLDDVILAVKKVHPYEQPAYDIFRDFSLYQECYDGIIGRLDKPMKYKKFVEYVKNILGCEAVRYTDCGVEDVETVALCSGAGGSYVKYAIVEGADAFVTGEIKHSDILEANHNGVMVVDAGHFRTEDLIMDKLKSILEDEFKGINFYRSKVQIDKIKYL